MKQLKNTHEEYKRYHIFYEDVSLTDNSVLLRIQLPDESTDIYRKICGSRSSARKQAHGIINNLIGSKSNKEYYSKIKRFLK
jgi:hypothetical protein